MKKLILTLLLIFSSLTLIVAGEQHLLPKPQISNFTNGGTFNLARSIKLTLPEIGENDPAVGEQLTELITSAGGSVASTSRNSIVVNIVDNVSGAEFQDEAYNIVVASSKITINAKTLRGAFWATQTLFQLAEDAQGRIQACQITDWPAFRIRGYMHDVGRGFIEFEELKNEIIKMSRFKVNTFHWHLTDNQGWRLESKKYPQLNYNSSFTRLAGKYYTIDQAKELVKLANQHGITIIPEIDMPGHSLAFRKAMGHSMLTSQGFAEMKEIMAEACETFEGTEWIHIGTDELRDEDKGSMNWTSFVPPIVALIREKGKKVVSWNPGYSYSASEIDMTQMWSSAGTAIPGVPAIDCRFHYTNHFDNFADIVSLYNATIARQTKGSDQYPGVILAFWNDRYLPNDDEILKQNQVWASTLAMVERAWQGGGKGYFDEIGVKTQENDADFIDWENRFLYHKANYLKDEPIPYVKQTNICWNITDAFPNNGDLTKSFPPENEIAEHYTYNGKKYNVKTAVGGSVYLRHVWGTIVPSFYTNPQPNHTAYAYTYVYSPKAQTVGAMIEFQNYSRSESDLAAPQGSWDYKGSRIWINDEEIPAPQWQNTHTTKDNEITLKNENMVARDPIQIELKEGWNKIFMKLPVGQFKLDQVRLVKWMFAFVLTTPDGKDAVEGLQYSTSPDIDEDTEHNVTVSSSQGGSAVVSESVVGHNQTTTLSATPQEGYEFVNWTVNGNVVSTNNPYVATITKDTEFVANFQKKNDEKYLSLDGTRYMYIPHHEDFNVSSSESFTLTLKVYANNIKSGNNSRFISKRKINDTNTNLTGYEFFGTNSSTNFVGLNTPNSSGNHNNSLSVWSTISSQAKTWYHIALVVDRSAGKIYFYQDGVEVGNSGTKSISGWACTNTLNVLVGAVYDGNNVSYKLDGAVDDLRFFSRALSASEIVSDRTSIVNSSTPNLIAAYDFSNINGTSVEDISGNGHTGVLVGFLTGIENTKEESSNIYSTKGIIHIDGYKGNVKILNVAGQVIKETNVTGNTQIEMNSGIYLVVTTEEIVKVIL